MEKMKEMAKEILGFSGSSKVCCSPTFMWFICRDENGRPRQTSHEVDASIVCDTAA